jgi:hypothetical protein
VAQPSSGKMITITGTGGDKTHTTTITHSVSIFPIDFAECTYSEPKPGRIDDGARRGLVSQRCGRTSAPAFRTGSESLSWFAVKQVSRVRGSGRENWR